MLIEIYNPKWVIQFEKIKNELHNTLTDYHYDIEHVGSTAVPGLAAKPIIDVDIIYYNPSDFANIKNKLELIGYYHNGNQEVEGREVFKRKKETDNSVLGKIKHHLYVCRHNCTELEKHILFRDYMIKHYLARNFYMNLKYKLASDANNDHKSYAALKELQATSFINFLVELAKQEKRAI